MLVRKGVIIIPILGPGQGLVPPLWNIEFEASRILI